ncbi:uncharacterized protein LOC117641296 isoform X2 [Thrips palmi]|uniref:Uncharacterized protein LOC117641296 isoform X2 n=1 Tax=Thrips palmi TaxID=161013 RepID=A0A6P8YC53_THRPL|nr:uncharacterized protein LOC117641296 isoform X2 [Thrips palmi]
MNSAAKTRGLLLGRLLCAIVVLLAAKAITAAVLGPYNAYVDRIYACAPGDSNSTEEIVNFIEVSKYDIRKQHILQRVTGNVTVSIKEGINNAMWAKARLDSRVHAHWADNAFTFSFDKACEQGRTHMPGVWSTFFKLDPTVNPCRVPPVGRRRSTGWITSPSTGPSPSSPSCPTAAGRST